MKHHVRQQTRKKESVDLSLSSLSPLVLTRIAAAASFIAFCLYFL